MSLCIAIMAKAGLLPWYVANIRHSYVHVFCSTLLTTWITLLQVTAYLIEFFSSKHMSLAELLAYLLKAKPDICINPGFLSQLHLFYYRHVFPAEYDLGS